MKRILGLILGIGVLSTIVCLMVANHLITRHQLQLAEQQAAWQAEKASLEAALQQASARSHLPPVVLPASRVAEPIQSSPVKLSPAEIVAKLVALKSAAGGQPRALRQAIYYLEELIALGPAALPAIEGFLAKNQDIEFAASNSGKGSRSSNNDFIVPPSLRFGLFDAARQIGGPEAEKLLAQVLGTTGRGVEVAWLARALQEIAPNKYRDTALAAARDLLARPISANGSSPLDRDERDQLFNVLTLYGDTSYVSVAQAQLIRPDGNVDRSALKYLQQSLGQQAVPLAAQFYDDPRVNDADKKETFARLALNFVGADPQADAFYQRAINDLTLPKKHRKNLIEDLNQDGFADTKHLTPNDLPLIQRRISLIEELAPNAADPDNAAAFREAYKDLLKMRERVLGPPQPRL